MPTPWGTDNTGEDYAPHMYIQHQYVGNEPVEFTVGNINYRLGVTGKSHRPTVICEAVEQGTWKTTALTVENFPSEAKEGLLKYLISEKSNSVRPDDQEYIRKAFGFPEEALTSSLAAKKKSFTGLNAFIATASEGREDANTAQRRHSTRKTKR